ncbi:MAG: phage tail fiber protein, partial [Synechococcus sp.]
MSTYATDTFAGDDSTVEFTLTFSYLSRDHIKVFRVEKSDGAETELSVITTGTPTGDEFIWESDNKIKVGTAPTVDQTLKIQRDTPEDQQLVPWADGSYLISEDLNDSDKQWLYNIQELSDLFTGLSFEAIKYRGTIDLTVDAAPANPQNGDYFINSGSGTVVASWTGIAGDSVQGSEQAIYNSALGEWQILQTPASQKGVLEVTGTAPIKVDNTDAQRPVVSVDAATTTDPGVINEAASDNVTYGRENGAWVAVANTAVSANPPANPGNGDGWYDLNTGRLYLWINDGDSSQWAEANPGLAGGGASVEVDDTPPLNPSDGDLWWDSSDDSGRLYVYYEDGGSNQWVEASPPAVGNPTVRVSDTPPANPEPGDLWWDSSETGGDNGGRLYFRYSDADSQQWVQTSNVGGANGQLWGKAGTTISPATAGDDLAADCKTTGDNGASGTGQVVGYQQGTWTPTGLQGVGSITGFDWSRIGNQVTISGDLAAIATGNSGAFVVQGIPYANTISGCKGACMSQGFSNPPTAVYITQGG